jgi:hypothetical protein
MGDDAQTMASFDADTQARATEALGKFLGVYHVSANLILATELGAAVQAALDAAGGDAASEAFQKRLSEDLLHVLYVRMADSERDGHEGPPGINATLRRSLVQRYGPLPAAVARHSLYVYRVDVDARSFEVAVPGPKVAADADVSGGPLGGEGEMAQSLVAAAARGDVEVAETTGDGGTLAAADLGRLLAAAISVTVNGPVAVR